MAVLTNKPVRFSSEILSGLGVREYFFRVYGGNSFEKKKPDPVGVAKLLEESGVARERALMVGDSSVDIQTARNASLPVVGVTFGFQPETLMEEPPDWLVDSLAEVADIALAAREEKGGIPT